MHLYIVSSGFPADGSRTIGSNIIGAYTDYGKAQAVHNSLVNPTATVKTAKFDGQKSDTLFVFDAIMIITEPKPVVLFDGVNVSYLAERVAALESGATKAKASAENPENPPTKNLYIVSSGFPADGSGTIGRNIIGVYTNYMKALYKYNSIVDPADIVKFVEFSCAETSFAYHGTGVYTLHPKPKPAVLFDGVNISNLAERVAALEFGLWN